MAGNAIARSVKREWEANFTSTSSENSLRNRPDMVDLGLNHETGGQKYHSEGRSTATSLICGFATLLHSKFLTIAG